MYAKFGKFIYLLLLPLVAVFFYITRSKRVRVIVMNEKGEILLVKSWFGRQRWSLPGGGVGVGEAPERAAERELHEETGITGVKATFLGQQKMGQGISRYTGLIFTAQVSSSVTIQPLPKYRHEIIGLQWFAKNDLPEHIAAIVTTHLKQG